MPSFTVEQIIGEPSEWQSQKGGPMLSYKLKLQGRDEIVELSQKKDTAPPAVGQGIEGEITPSGNQYPDKLKKAYGGGGFSGGGMSPEREKRIVRQHSQSMSIETLKLAVDCGVNLQVATVGDIVVKVKQLADAFDKDAGV